MATPRGSHSSASLLPYLQRSNVDSPLKLSLLPVTPLLKSSAPFVVLDDSDPIARLIEGFFLTDAGSILKKVFLSVQKDNYLLPDGGIGVLTNPQIDLFWQRSFSALQARSGSSRVLFSSQSDDLGNLMQFSPLFFCKTRETFFHPVCPYCGTPLQLCIDDSLLAVSGLRPYSTSHKRYLYCTDCCLAGSRDFYAYERSHSDPDNVQDRWSLLDHFRMIDAAKDTEDQFPCVRCPERDHCYGSDSAVRSRMIPFSFYPFYLLIFDAPSLHALDFLHLASGATFDQLEALLDHRRNPCTIALLKEARQEGLSYASLFPLSDDRFFLELLLLKLSFLREVLAQVLSDKVLQTAKVRIDRIWVTVPKVNGTLPSFWNFSVEIIDDIAPAINVFGSKPPETEALAYLGFLWLQVFIQNSVLGQSDLLHAVNDYLEGKSGADYSSAVTSPLEAMAVQENIFWVPGAGNINKELLPLWQKVIAPGFMLLDASLRNVETLSCDELVQLVESMTAEIKSVIFEKPAPREEQVIKPLAADDRMLHGIVTGLIDRYRGEIGSQPVTKSCQHADETLETVMLPPESDKSQNSESEFEITETVIISSSPTVSGVPLPPQKAPAIDDMLETVLISPGRTDPERCNKPTADERETAEPLQPKIEAEIKDDDLLETVIISPAAGRRRPDGFR